MNNFNYDNWLIEGSGYWEEDELEQDYEPNEECYNADYEADKALNEMGW